MEKEGKSKYKLLQKLSKFPRADWLVAVVCKSTDNKNDVKCKARAFLTENKANSVRTFTMLLKKKIQVDGGFLWSIILKTIK